MDKYSITHCTDTLKLWNNPRDSKWKNKEKSSLFLQNHHSLRVLQFERGAEIFKVLEGRDILIPQGHMETNQD